MENRRRIQLRTKEALTQCSDSIKYDRRDAVKMCDVIMPIIRDKPAVDYREFRYSCLLYDHYEKLLHQYLWPCFCILLHEPLKHGSVELIFHD